ncbi:MAG: fatty acid desaturase, partial [Vicinamibacterales bacterium]
MASAAAIASRRVRVRTGARAWDAAFVGLSLAHAALLVTVPSIPVIALGLWWNANTIAHNFIHRPFFRSRAANRGYSAWLTLILGVPQAVWRARHLAHHAGAPGRPRFDRDVVVDTVLVVSLWATIVAIAPTWFVTVYLPGWVLGLALCQVHGHYEHARGTTSHYGRLYNLLFFNDGYHVEHHARPARHWAELADERRADVRGSRWPPILRWLEPFSLQSLERLVLRSPALQRYVLSTHERALRRLQPALGDVRRVLVVGGGLF